MTMWTEKYRPTRINEILGNEEAKAKAVQWLKNWKPATKPLLLYGVPGTGKTTLAHILANQFNYNLIEMNTSDQRTEAKINEIAGRASQSTSLDLLFKQRKGTLIFFDEVDGIYGREDYGGVSAILKIIDKTQVPVILAANDINSDKIAPIISASQIIQLYQVRLPILVTFLRHICKQESVKADSEAIKMIAKNSRGDVRSALNDLQMYAMDGTLTKEEVFDFSRQAQLLSLQEVLTRLFKTDNFYQARVVMNASQTPLYRDEVILTLHDNIPYIYKGHLTQLASIYQSLSNADILLKRMKTPGRPHWYLIPYFLEMLALMLISNPPPTPPSSIMYPPQKIIQMGRTKKERLFRTQISQKIKARCHLSTRAASTEILPYLKILYRSNKTAAQHIQDWLNLAPDEIAYIEKK